MLTTDVLIVGSGPTGSTMALALSSLGVPSLVVTKHRWLAHTPRAHVVSQRAMEVFRDLGVEDQVRERATPQELLGETVFCTGLAGEELGRIRSFGTHPSRRADYTLASPCEVADLPQHVLEPILLGSACARGALVRFETEYLSMTQDADGVTATVRDRLSGATYEIRAKYLVGGDGANSAIAREVALPMEGSPGRGGMVSIWANADLTRFVAHRPGSLYWVIKPDPVIGGARGGVRMVRPWHQWVFACPYGDDPDVGHERATRIIHSLIGDDTVPIEILAIFNWTISPQWATRFSAGRIFCVGDAVHRQPPNNALGANTAVQEAHNLAWKLALVLEGKAAPSLLESYGAERAPIARQIVERALRSGTEYQPLLEALGFEKGASPEQIRARMEARKGATPEAAEQRRRLREAIALKSYELNCHGVEMNQRYCSAAIVPDGTLEPAFPRDPELYYHATTWPGARLPHVWLGRNGRRVSTLDVVGKGRFTLLTGIGGDAWLEAAARVSRARGIGLDAKMIGPGRDLTDLYGDWASACETGEAGCLLVRPDAFVAFRAQDATGADEKLALVMTKILGR